MPQSIRSTTAARAAVFAPLAGGGRAELVAQRLTDAIELGLLTHGERLPSETEMARQFGVATVTTREALETLRERGLVETRRGRDGGSFVTAASRTESIDRRVRALSRVELRDMGVYYSAIAAMAAELAADRATDDDLEHLHDTIEAVDATSETSTRRGEGTFRLEIAALSQSARLVREELRLQAEFAPLLWLCLRDQAHRERSLAAHLEVVAAIAANDGPAARRATVGHIAEAIEWLLDAKADLEGQG
ncbi:MAG: GntR family transcriptional regulator [Actinobacteria bacterium]|nr:GntR family transcriptional regulator [Actinomycetota bacterium]